MRNPAVVRALPTHSSTQSQPWSRAAGGGVLRREAQRRHARMCALAAVSLTIAAAMGLLAYATLLARNEAQHQRAEAGRARGDVEGLIEFMLTDLREKLAAARNWTSPMPTRWGAAPAPRC